MSRSGNSIARSKAWHGKTGASGQQPSRGLGWGPGSRDSRERSRWQRTEPPKQTIPNDLAVAMAKTMDDQTVARERNGRTKTEEVGVSCHVVLRYGDGVDTYPISTHISHISHHTKSPSIYPPSRAPVFSASIAFTRYTRFRLSVL